VQLLSEFSSTAWKTLKLAIPFTSTSATFEPVEGRIDRGSNWIASFTFERVSRRMQAVPLPFTKIQVFFAIGRVLSKRQCQAGGAVIRKSSPTFKVYELCARVIMLLSIGAFKASGSNAPVDGWFFQEGSRPSLACSEHPSRAARKGRNLSLPLRVLHQRRTLFEDGKRGNTT